MYDFTVTIKDPKTGQILDEKLVKYGVRSIELVRDYDTETFPGHAKGRSFYFKLNSIPIYAKGGNYVPRSIF